MELTTTIADQRYCRDADGGQASLQIFLRLHYANRGDRPIIVARGGHSITRESISSNIREANQGKHVFELDFTVVNEGPRNWEDDKPGRDFIVLQPGSNYETVAVTPVVVFLKTPGTDEFGVTFAPGRYVLQATVSTFPSDPIIAERLAERWKGSGELWSRPLTSIPLEFQISDKPQLQACGP